MGNVLRLAKEKLTLDQFKEYLNLLKGVTYKLLLKRHIDVAIEMHENIQKDEIDYLDGNTAGAVLANIRFKNTNDEEWYYNGTMPSVSEYNCDIAFSDEIMDTNPRFWTIGQLVAGMLELEKCRIEFFGDDTTTETPPTNAEKKAATIQATLAVFKSVFAHLPEQTAPAPATESPQDTLPVECRMYKTRKESDGEELAEFLARTRAGFAQNKTYDEIVYEILQERKLKKSAEAKLTSTTSEQSSTEIKEDTEKKNQSTTQSIKSPSNDKKTSTEKKSRRKSNKSSKKTKVENPIAPEKKNTLEETSDSNPSLRIPIVENVESEPITGATNANTGSNLSLDIPVTIEVESTLSFSDSLSEAFLPNSISILTKTGKVAGQINDSDSLANITNQDLSPDIDISDHELLEGVNDEPSEPDEPLPDAPEPLLD